MIGETCKSMKTAKYGSLISLWFLIQSGPGRLDCSKNQWEISDPYLAVFLDLHVSPITDFDWVFLYFEARPEPPARFPPALPCVSSASSLLLLLLLLLLHLLLLFLWCWFLYVALAFYGLGTSLANCFGGRPAPEPRQHQLTSQCPSV